MDYKQFKIAYEASGLTQKAYGKKIGKSASMVHYYLRRARQEPEEITIAGSFQELLVDRTIGQQITITTPRGLQIVIPI